MSGEFGTIVEGDGAAGELGQAPEDSPQEPISGLGCLALQRGGQGETRDALDQRQKVAALGAELQEVALPVAEFPTPIDGLWSLVDGAAAGDRFAPALNPGLFAVLPAVTPGGTLTFTPAAATTGSATIDVELSDDGGTGNGGDDTAPVVSFQVDVAQGGLYYLRETGSGADYDLSVVALPPGPIADYEGDDDPGLTIDKSGGGVNEPDPDKYQNWNLSVPSTMELVGPVVLNLWSATEDFDDSDPGHIHAYLRNCDAGGTGCVTIAQVSQHIDPWSPSGTWTFHGFSLGAVDHTIAAGRMLQVKLLHGHDPLWVSLADGTPTTLTVPPECVPPRPPTTRMRRSRTVGRPASMWWPTIWTPRSILRP